MASSAAVGADISKSPIQDVDVAEGFSGRVKSATPPPIDDEEDDDIGPTRRRPAAISSMFPDGDSRLAGAKDDEDEPLDDADIDEGGLFGDDDDDLGDDTTKVRQLDDEELDSGDDIGRHDREAQYGEDAEEQVVDEQSTMELEFGKHGIPEPSDGELYLLKVPRFLGIEQHAFKPTSFRPPTTDHHNKGEASNTFSAHATALSTIRWRLPPSSDTTSPKSYQSNARILRWSDGSLTLQFAHAPLTQYRLPAGALAPPQQHPVKPTPLTGRSGRRQRAPYDSEKDSFTYIVAPQAAAQVLRTTNKLTTSLKVSPAANDKNTSSKEVEDLQLALARASRGGMGEMGGIGFVEITEDPELAKKNAELAEKEKLRAQKRRDTQQERNREKLDRGGRRPGAFGGGGLNAAMLEDDDELGAGVGGGRPRTTKPRAKPKRSAASRRGEILTDEDEDFDRGRHSKEDEYDEEDDFLVADEDEEEIPDEDEDEDIDEGVAEEPSARRKGSPKRSRNEDVDAEGEADVDAEGEPDDQVEVRSKRRRIIEDEDED